MSALENVKEQVLAECEDDFVGLWAIIRALEDTVGSMSPPLLRALTIEFLTPLLHGKEIEAGKVAPDGRHFVPIKESTEFVIKQLSHDWPPGGERPSLGDSLWFTRNKPGWFATRR
jgi:hypothetical protein